MSLTMFVILLCHPDDSSPCHLPTTFNNKAKEKEKRKGDFCVLTFREIYEEVKVEVVEVKTLGGY